MRSSASLPSLKPGPYTSPPPKLPRSTSRTARGAKPLPRFAEPSATMSDALRREVRAGDYAPETMELPNGECVPFLSEGASEETRALYIAARRRLATAMKLCPRPCVSPWRNAPCPRACAGMCADGLRAFTFGGFDGHTVCDDAHIFLPTAGAWLPLASSVTDNQERLGDFLGGKAALLSPRRGLAGAGTTTAAGSHLPPRPAGGRQRCAGSTGVVTNIAGY